MLKTLLPFFALFALFSCQGQAVVLWEEGTHYKVISDKASEKPEVLEFFSYWCPHCYNFEPLVGQIKKKLPEGVAFTKVHVNFMGFTGPDVQDEATRALMVARALKREDQVSDAIFKHIHQERKLVAGQDDLATIFQKVGIDGEKYQKMAKSFGVSSQLKKNNKTIGEYRRHLSGVPNFIVNGKYQAVFTRDMSTDDIVELIVWLSTQK